MIADYPLILYRFCTTHPYTIYGAEPRPARLTIIVRTRGGVRWYLRPPWAGARPPPRGGGQALDPPLPPVCRVTFPATPSSQKVRQDAYKTNRKRMVLTRQNTTTYELSEDGFGGCTRQGASIPGAQAQSWWVHGLEFCCAGKPVK